MVHKGGGGGQICLSENQSTWFIGLRMPPKVNYSSGGKGFPTIWVLFTRIFLGAERKIQYEHFLNLFSKFFRMKRRSCETLLQIWQKNCRKALPIRLVLKSFSNRFRYYLKSRDSLPENHFPTITKLPSI